MVKDTQPRYTAYEWSIMEGGHTFEEPINELTAGFATRSVKRATIKKKVAPITPGPRDRMAAIRKRLATESKEPNEREYDYEGEMAKLQLRGIIRNATDLMNMMEDNTNLAEWVQNKITKAADYLDVARDYMMNDVNENFIDGRNPQDKGDSARHGIPKKASISDLKKIRSSDSASPRKKQLAHWQINMRKGRSK